MKCLLLLLLLQRCIHLTICQAEDGYSPRLLTAEENANESTCVEQPTYNVLPADYDKLMPPLLKGVPLNIYFTLWIISITEINELRQDFTVDLYLRMYWVDFRIKYPVCEKRPFIVLNHAQLDKIWIPDIFFKQEKRSSRHFVNRRNAGLKLTKSTNEVFFSERITLTTYCAYDFRFFPLDRQACVMAFESYSLDGRYANLSFKPLAIHFDKFKFKIPQYELNYVSPYSCYYDYMYEGSYFLNQSCIQANFVFDRQFSYYFVQMYLPSILIVLVSFLSFWIPVDNVPGRVSLGVTSLLTLATQFTTIQRSLPPVSYVKAMDIWMFFCIVTVFLAMVEFTLAYNFRFTLAQDGDRKPKPVKEPVTVLGINSIAAGLRQPRVVVLTQPEEGKTPFAVLKLSVYWVAERFAKKKGNFIDNFSKLLFPIAFLVFNLAYWNHYGKGQKEVTFWGG
ncbi:glycine receptor subunit alphaZ1-like [Amphibalanus amphitrite]|uniref:glycine receptor subunit alphaZ1-like n=1 Tax=Amphibalanus amphitrite TaxID=1232801 RepID=UPI001C92A50A|nr:glycine receptor subunit alphaZ1-like [Amphibalanus amphitrite]